MMMMMEREVTDSDGVFSKRLSGNWAELPQTLRKKQKHRPEILSQFTDMSESECEYRRVESSASSHYQQSNNNNQPVNKRIVKRSEFLRRLENRNLLHLQHQPPPPPPPIQYPSQTQTQQQQQYNRRSMPDYRLRYEAQDIRRRSLVNLENGNTPTTTIPHFSEKYNAKLHLSDDERKTNSPDSLLVRSSESESSISDEYGHTDDSGAFLEKASSFENNNNNKKRSSGSSSNGKRFEAEIQQQPQPQQSIPLRHRFAKFFTKSGDEHKSANGKSSDSKLDVNKNNVTQTKKESLVQRFDYENIPRIDIAKLEQRSTSSFGLNNRNVSSPQPTIEQLRAEEGCQLRNRRNSVNSSIFGNEQQQRSAEEMRLEGLIKDYYTGDEARSVAAERKLSKMETIREEKDGSKLSVREILKRFEELRSQNDSQLMDERSSDRTLTTIQETLKKLDEKVKSYQVCLYR